MKRLIGFAILLAAFTLSFPEDKPPVSVPLSFDNYYTLDRLFEALKALNAAFPELTTLEVAGKSEEGRPLYAMTVNNPKTGAPLDKPGIYVDGNIHGNEIQGGDISLYLLDYLLGNYGKNPEITQLVDRACFYVVPVVNVDGRYHFFADANTSSSNRGLRIPTDDDHDGLVDEDPDDDLDGDGNICVMRIKDPFGRFKTDPEDARLMIPIKPGEKGEWTILGQEGIDNDGDGQINEDGEGYVDTNRNWGFDWAPPYVESGSGEYPFSGTGVRGLANWIAAKTNICVGWSYHNMGGMVLRGPARKGLGEYPQQDVEVYDYIGKQAERILPGYRYMISWKDLYTTYGDSVEWLAACIGAYAYCSEVFQVQTEAFRGLAEKPEARSPAEEGVMAMMSGGMVDRERLKFSDNLAQGELYKPEVKPAGKDLYRVRTRLVNSRAIPSMSYLAQKSNLYPKDMLRVAGPSAKVVAGGLLTDPYINEVIYKKYRPEVQFLVVPGFGKVEHQFLVEGKGEITVKYDSRHAGKLAKTAVLK
jgi:hypothetical protein